MCARGKFNFHLCSGEWLNLADAEKKKFSAMNIARLGCQAYEEGLVPEAELPKENTCKERLVIGEKKKNTEI